MKPSNLLFYFGLAFIVGALAQLIYLLAFDHFKFHHTMFIIMDIMVGIVALCLRSWVRD